MALPTFLIIGAMKAGTTSLWRYLDMHPDVFMARPKELHFFSDEKRTGQSREWYERCFALSGEARAIGEASTSYSKYPALPEVPHRIARLLPNAKIIYLVRHPIERMVSQYVHNYADGIEHEPIGRALFRQGPHHNRYYIDFSRYATQVERYLDVFDRDQILIIRSEDLRDDRQGTVATVLGFIGVGPHPDASELEKEYYVSTERSELKPWTRRLKTHLPFRPTHILPRAARRRMRILLSRRMETPRPRLSPRCEAELASILRPEVERLGPFMPADFDGWGLV